MRWCPGLGEFCGWRILSLLLMEYWEGLLRCKCWCLAREVWWTGYSRVRLASV